ncbi:hypothetical protein BURK1_01080 [Burkholderiales bacterium]|nr:hypothetical protein BURK1_01080 [Burkholderiales bacterium]
MISTLALRAALTVAALAVSTASQAQAPSATTEPAPPAATAPATAAAPAATPQAGAPGAGAPAADGKAAKRERRATRGNFMRANPDATPVLPGQTPKGAGRTAAAGADTPGGQGTSRQRGRGMAWAFAELQSDTEKAAYVEKVRGVKTYAECMSLLDSTKKALEPRAKAQNKTISVDATEICERRKQRGRITG